MALQDALIDAIHACEVYAPRDIHDWNLCATFVTVSHGTVRWLAQNKCEVRLLAIFATLILDFSHVSRSLARLMRRHEPVSVRVLRL